MPMIQWDKNLSVNVKEIDEQHKKLVSMLNDLFDAMTGNEDREKVIADILNRMVEYTQVHFQTEEKYFEKFGYPSTKIHKLEHEDFVIKVADFKKKFDSGRSDVTISVMNFLSEWLIKHIKGSDKKYSKFFNDNGLK